MNRWKCCRENGVVPTDSKSSSLHFLLCSESFHLLSRNLARKAMPFIENATCKFHDGIARPDFLSDLREQVLVFGTQSVELIKSTLRNKTVDLVQRIHEWQDILVCGGCYKALAAGQSVAEPLHCKSSFLLIDLQGKQGHVSQLQVDSRETLLLTNLFSSVFSS